MNPSQTTKFPSSFQFKVQEDGLSLLEAIHQHFEGKYSKNAIKRLLDKKVCFVNHSMESFASTKVKVGDLIVAKLPAQTSYTTTILYEDSYLKVINKPPGMVCDDPMLAHRLDKETSGCLLIAKEEKTLQALHKMFKERKVKKEYLAITISSKQLKKKGVMEDVLVMQSNRKGQKHWRIGTKGEKGKSAYTEYSLVRKEGELAFVHLYPKTGRMHQLRVQLKALNAPIIGDYKYHYPESFPIHSPRHLLHAYRLEFTHPISNKKLSIEAPIPDDFYEVMPCVF